MSRMTYHRTARVPNEPFRVAGMTIPQVLAVIGAFAVGAAGWWALGLLHVGGLGFFFLRSISAGLVAGLLGLVAYAAFDAHREPLVRQTLGYASRRHVYRREDTLYGSAVVPFPAHPATGKKSLAPLVDTQKRLGRRTRRGRRSVRP